MKKPVLLILAIIGIILYSCSTKMYSSNGESIYRTGKNLAGEYLLDKNKSQITLFHSCQRCHGKNGDAMKACNIKWSYLSNPQYYNIPYNDSLFFRFLDLDLKSDGTPARTGVHWKLSETEKKELLDFIKTLKEL